MTVAVVRAMMGGGMRGSVAMLNIRKGRRGNAKIRLAYLLVQDLSRRSIDP